MRLKLPIAATATLAAALMLLAPGLSFADFTTAKVISTPNRAGDEPQVAVYGKGNAIMVWRELDGGKWRIKLRTGSANGELGAIQNISPAGQNADLPQVAVNAHGNAVVVWKRFNGTNWVVDARARANGGALGPLKQLSGAGQNADLPHVAIDSTGKALVVWKRFNGMKRVIELRQRAPNGALGAVTQISDPSQNADTPLVSMAADGSALLLWDRSEAGGVYFIEARSRAANGALGSITTLSESMGNRSRKDVAMMLSGRAMVVWVSGAGDVVMRARSAAGEFGPTQTIATDGNETAQIALAPDGSGVIAWREYDPTFEDYRLRAVSRSGTGVLVDLGFLSTNRARAEVDYALAIDEIGPLLSRGTSRLTTRPRGCRRARVPPAVRSGRPRASHRR